MTEESVREFEITINAILSGVFMNAYMQGEVHKNIDNTVINIARKEILSLIVSILPEERKYYETEASVLFADGWNAYRAELLGRLE